MKPKIPKKPNQQATHVPEPGRELEPRVQDVSQTYTAGPPPRGQGGAGGQGYAEAVMMSQKFSGPLPPPDVLRRYEETIPGLGKTIVDLMVQEGRHRHEMESRQLAMAEKWSAGDLVLQARGQIFGFLLGIVGIAGGLTVASFGHPTEGVIVSSASLTAIVIAFLKRRTAGSDGGEPEEEEEK